MSSRLIPLAAPPLLLLSGCFQHTHEEAPAPEEHEHPAVVVTVWDQGQELFVEYPVPVAGEPVVVVTHVTTTATGAPRTEGPVTFVLRSASGEELRHEDPAPARDGIYLPELAFPTTGEWTITVEVPVSGGVASVSLPATRVHATHDEALAAELPPEVEGISFLKEQAWRLGTQIAPLSRREAAPRVAVPAVVRVVPARHAVVTPPVAGRLEAYDGAALPALGDLVSAGDVLGYVRPPFSEYVAKLQGAEAEVVRTALASDRAGIVRSRVESLFEIEARTALQVEESRFDAELAAADHDAAVRVRDALAAAGASLLADGTLRFELRAPISGVVREVASVSGAHVAVGEALVVLRDSSVVHVEAHVRPEDLAEVTAVDRPLLVHLHGQLSDAEAFFVPEARLVLVGDEIDAHNLTVPVVFELPNADGHLHIGELIEVQFPIGEPSAELLLPRTAIVEEDGMPVAYVQLGGETFEKRHLELGFRDGEHVQVLSGIDEGEWVVVAGAFAVRLASATGGGPSHGHSH